jgi:hypothetical protein
MSNMMVTIKRYGEDTCAWCMERGEGVQAEFQDGLKGFFCKRDFWSAVKARQGKKLTRAETKAADHNSSEPILSLPAGDNGVA